MSKQQLKTAWGQFLVGVAMLSLVVLAGLVRMSCTYGFGKALAMVALGIFIGVWVIVGVILICRGLHSL